MGGAREKSGVGSHVGIVGSARWHSSWEAMIIVPASRQRDSGRRSSIISKLARGDPASSSLFSAPVPLPLASQDLAGVGVRGHLLCDDGRPPLTAGGPEVTGHCHV